MNRELEKVFTERGFTNIEQMATMFDWYKEEIERLKKRLEESQLAFLQVDKDKQRLNSIIKEVREYINSIGWNTTIPNIQDNVWRILDKEKE